MKIQKTELAAKLNQIKGVVPKKTTMPILQGILVKEGYLIANNLEMTIKAKLEGTEDECFIIPERAFDLINNLPDGEIDITISGGNTMTIKADKIKNKYQTMDPVPFPVSDIEGEGSEFTIKAGLLLESVRRVSYAIPQQGGNATMSTMCLQAKDGQLNFVGLDGHVLAWDKIDYDGEFESIKRSATRTAIIVSHIETMFGLYDAYCEKSPNQDIDRRRYDVVWDKYMAEPVLTVKEIAAKHNMSKENVYSDLRVAEERLTALIFGVDGLKVR